MRFYDKYVDNWRRCDESNEHFNQHPTQTPKNIPVPKIKNLECLRCSFAEEKGGLEGYPPSFHTTPRQVQN